MGNIISLNRTGGKAASLAYTYYNGGMDNRLQTVTNNTTAFRSYAYDANGNATTDGGGKTLIFIVIIYYLFINKLAFPLYKLMFFSFLKTK